MSNKIAFKQTSTSDLCAQLLCCKCCGDVVVPVHLADDTLAVPKQACRGEKKQTWVGTHACGLIVRHGILQNLMHIFSELPMRDIG